MKELGSQWDREMTDLQNRQVGVCGAQDQGKRVKGQKLLWSC